MSRIQVLTDQVANKIAAGEVVERPASVVKELVENALDAGATKISVHLEKGGRNLIRVEDNGHGMDSDDAVLCFERHATSKLRDSEELLSIRTLGFRGEALPSIASVANVRLQTRAEGDELGTEVRIEGGVLRKVEPIAWSGGTSIEIRSLFFNTPARRKFLRTEQTELRHITKMLTQLALSQPEVHVICQHHDRRLLDLVSYEEPLERVASLYGAKMARSLTRVDRKIGAYRVQAYIGPLHDTKTGNDYQHLFVNGRTVQSATLRAALRDAFHLVLPKGRMPVVLLYLDAPHDQVDVNVHPTKAEVRFFSPRDVRKVVTETLGEHLVASVGQDFPEMRLERSPDEKLRMRLDSIYGPEPGFSNPSEGQQSGTSQNQDHELPQTLLFRENTGIPVAPDFQPNWAKRPTEPHSHQDPNAPHPPEAPPRPQGLGLSKLRYIGQLANTFFLLEDGEGMVIVDQHVVHERVLVEELMDNARSAEKVEQPLLIPQVIELEPAACMALERGDKALRELGFEIDPLDANSVAVRSAPAALPLAQLEETVQMLARRLQDEDADLPDAAELIEESLIMASCKGAIKANDPIDPQRARALLERLDKARHPFSCPHGRPVYFRLPLKQIEREFGRMGFEGL